MPIVIVVHFKDGTSSDTEQEWENLPGILDIIKVQIVGRSVLCKVTDIKKFKPADSPAYQLVEAQEL